MTRTTSFPRTALPLLALTALIATACGKEAAREASHGSDARAAAYVECVGADGRTIWGVGVDEDVATAGVRAVLSAANAA